MKRAIYVRQLKWLFDSLGELSDSKSRLRQLQWFIRQLMRFIRL